MKKRRLQKPTKKATAKEVYDFWNQAIEDQDYMEQRAIVDAHISPNDIENMDVDRWNEIMSAKAQEDRPIDMFGFLNNQKSQGKGEEVK